jgi:hypothetical protein
MYNIAVKRKAFLQLLQRKGLSLGRTEKDPGLPGCRFVSPSHKGRLQMICSEWEQMSPERPVQELSRKTNRAA